MLLTWRDVSPGSGPGIPTSLTLDETDKLKELAAGKKVLEIGSAYGYSAIVMALAGADVVAVDPHQQLNSYWIMKQNLDTYGVSDLVQVVQDDSGIMSAMGKGQFDLIWIDGDHSEAAVEHDVTRAVQLLKPDGYLACHDYNEDTCPGVAAFLNRWKTPPLLVDTMAVYGPGEW